MAFKVFEKTRATSDVKTVTISTSGSIVLSPAIVEKYFKDAEYVQILFDAEHRKAGIKPVKQGTKFAYRLIRPPKGKTRSFSGQAFLRTHKINLAGEKFEKQVFEKLEFEGGMLVFGVK